MRLSLSGVAARLAVPALGSGTWRAIRERIDPFVLLILLLPFVILTYDSSWLITFPSHLDPWYSLAFFRELPATLRFASTYYGSDRIAYWIPGSIVHHAFSPLWANHVLRFCYFYLATLSLYSTLSQTLGRKTALVTTVLLGTYWHFQSEIGWNYVDGAGVAYLLLTLAALTRAGQATARSFWLAAAGAAFAAAINTNIILAETIVPLFIYHAGSARQKGATLRRIVWDSLAFIAGGLALTAILGIYYYAATHKVLYSATFDCLRSLAKAGPNRSTSSELGYEVPTLLTWLPAARWLEIPVFVACSAVVHLASLRLRRSAPANPFVSLFHATFLAHAALYVVMQSLSMHVLHIAWYAIYLVPFMFLSLAGLLCRPVERLPGASVVAACAVGLGVLIVLFSVPPKWREFAFFPTVIGLLLLSGYVRRRLLVVTLVMVAFGISNYTRELPVRDSYDFRKDSYLAITDGIKAIKQQGVPMDSISFWYKPNEQTEDYIYSSLNAAYMWGYTRYPGEYPNLWRDGTGRALPPRPLLVVLTKEPGAFETARDRLREANVTVKLIREERITRGQVSFTMTLMWCEGKPEPARTP